LILGQLVIASEQPLAVSDDYVYEFELDEIVVEAKPPSENYQFGDVIPEYNSSFHSIISAKQFEGKITDIAQVISQYSPAQIRDTGGLGSFSTISLRGSSGARLPIFIDGILLNENSTGSVNLSSLSLGQIEQIEIYRGIVPMTLSQASIAGAINIRTLRVQKPTANIAYGIGSFGTQKLEGHYSNMHKHWNYSISAIHQQSDNNYPYYFNNGTEHNLADDRMTNRNHNAFAQNNVQLKASAQLTNSTRTIFNLESSNQNKELPVWSNHDDPKTYLDSSSVATSFKIIQTNTNLNYNTTIGFKRSEMIFSDRFTNLGVGAQHVKYLTQKGFINFYGETGWLNHIFSINTEISHEKYDPTYYFGTEFYADSTRAVLNLGLQSQSFFYSDRLIVVPGYRLHQTITHQEKSEFHDEVDSNNSDYSLQFGIQWKIDKELKLKNNWSKYHRIPTFTELYSDAGINKGSPTIKPETSYTVDFGIEGISEKTALFNSLNYSASLFQTYIDNVITWIPNAQGVGVATNLSKSEVRGSELKIDVVISELTTWGTLLTINDARITDGPFGTSNTQLPGQAQFKTNNYLLFHFWNAFQFKLEANAEVGRFYYAQNKLELDDQYRINTSLTWQQKNWRTDFHITNLFNQLSEDYYLAPLPGRSFHANVKYTFK